MSLNDRNHCRDPLHPAAVFHTITFSVENVTSRIFVLFTCVSVDSHRQLTVRTWEV